MDLLEPSRPSSEADHTRDLLTMQDTPPADRDSWLQVGIISVPPAGPPQEDTLVAVDGTDDSWPVVVCGRTSPPALCQSCSTSSWTGMATLSLCAQRGRREELLVVSGKAIGVSLEILAPSLPSSSFFCCPSSFIRIPFRGSETRFALL